jgi:hypothetical protein
MKKSRVQTNGVGQVRGFDGHGIDANPVLSVAELSKLIIAPAADVAITDQLAGVALTRSNRHR